MKNIRRSHRMAAALALICLLVVAGCQNMLASGAGAGVGASASGTSLASIRSEHGLPPLKPDPRLERAAAQQAGYMARAAKMAHRTGWGKDFTARMRENGIEGAAAENVAHGRMAPERLFSMWMASPGHRRNMLDPRFAHYGLGSAEDGRGQKYWALVLAR